MARLWFDDLYDWYVAAVQQRVARFLAMVDFVVIGGLLVRGSAAMAGLLGLAARGAHTGNLNTYLYWFFAGLVAVWLVVFGVW